VPFFFTAQSSTNLLKNTVIARHGRIVAFLRWWAHTARFHAMVRRSSLFVGEGNEIRACKAESGD
jgi:hypothetical protein